ncbi:SagB/ThcOx family dehydrogenase [Streptomyces sp. NPDC006553]|uniref:SagB/ThcOx family dehydrogenase n=1 Tax=Streptomyces sp. NPDC006553 TaxID=3157180 RepID=UPI00339E2E44
MTPVAPTLARTYRRYPLLRVRLGGPLHCDLLLDGTSYELPSPALVGIVSALDGVHTLAEFTAIAAGLMETPQDAAAVIDALAEAGILVPSDVPWPQMPAVEHWIERGWLDALVFHLRAGATRFTDDGAHDPKELQDRLLRPLVDEGVDVWTRYPDAPEHPLPPAVPREELPPLSEVLLNRRSNRPWRGTELTRPELATLLQHAGAETLGLRREVERRMTSEPSALLGSAFSALEVYVAVFAVEGLPPGLYHYAVDRHTLALLRPGDLRKEFTRMCAGQARAGSGSATLVVAADWRRYMRRYQGPHAYRVLLTNAAELGQKLLLLATALGLSTFLTPAFDDTEADHTLGLRPDVSTPIEAIGVG